MLKPPRRTPQANPCLITVQDNTMLKLWNTRNNGERSLITVQDNTMLKPIQILSKPKLSLITVQDNTMLKLKQ